jgi:hypothetical protein
MRDPAPSWIAPPKATTSDSISENTMPPKVGFVKTAARVRVCFDFMLE